MPRRTLGKYILDAAGEPVRCDDLFTWAEWFETADRSVALDRVGEVEVSTVFLGIDHNHGDRGPPILFETMIFGGDLDGRADRYATRSQAVAAHDQLVAALRAKEPPR